ncbi:GNAT family N-acetyltransferase [Gynuella sunshinyii]|uniref:Acetyltransferase n=1 Tax=Gynuella sunshinyii YC6258 TaxID=1445510 RepID=A0A0C5VRA4_9GAMM|nr:GNAT family N-acetyltransferase [Gynuella sunshinyii]AJQ92744.1 acetyltransferase [Gynuella sunshinyii YC6258]
MVIRKATPADLDGLVTLNHQIGEYHHLHAPNVFAPPSPEAAEFIDKALQDTNRIFLVCELDNHIVGFLTAVIEHNRTIPFLVAGPICRVSTLIVDERCRSQGIGKQLMSECEQLAISQGALEIRLEVMEFNQGAQSFYQALGFQTQSRIMSRLLG